MSNSILIQATNKVLGIYALVLVVLGTLLNVIICVVCLRKKLRDVNTFKFFAIISISDTIALYEWNLKHFMITFYNVDFNYTSLAWCRVNIFLQYLSLQFSAWILVRILFYNILIDRAITR